jgi:hypothetical protein
VLGKDENAVLAPPAVPLSA